MICRCIGTVAGDLEVSGTDQSWVADFSYILLETEFVYLAVVLDATRGGSLDGPWTGPWKPNFPCGWHWRSVRRPPHWCIMPTRVACTPRANDTGVLRDNGVTL